MLRLGMIPKVLVAVARAVALLRVPVAEAQRHLQDPEVEVRPHLQDRSHFLVQEARADLAAPVVEGETTFRITQTIPAI